MVHVPASSPALSLCILYVLLTQPKGPESLTPRYSFVLQVRPQLTLYSRQRGERAPNHSVCTEWRCASGAGQLARSGECGYFGLAAFSLLSLLLFYSLREDITATNGLLMRSKCLWTHVCVFAWSWVCVSRRMRVCVHQCILSVYVCVCVSLDHSQQLAVLVHRSPLDAWMITLIIAVVVFISTRGSQDSLALRASRVCQGSLEPRWALYTIMIWKYWANFKSS